MNATFNLEELVLSLNEKGYTGYFQTQAAYPGKLKDSLEQFFKHESENKNDLVLRTYLLWNGDQSPSIQCYIRLHREKEGFLINRMDIEHRDRYGQLLKDVTLKGLTIQSIPTVNEAINLVRNQEQTKIKRRGLGL